LRRSSGFAIRVESEQGPRFAALEKSTRKEEEASLVVVDIYMLIFTGSDYRK